MSLPRSLPPSVPDAALVVLFTQIERIHKSVRRQAEFYVFFAQVIFPLL